MDIFNSILSWLGDQVNNLLSFLISVLPDSPFQLLDSSPISDIIGYINYFVPVAFMIDILTAWVACIVVYYGYSIIMRWFKIIQ